MQGGGGGWQKPEPEQASPPQNERPSSLVGNSNWASRQQEQAASVSQQPLAVENPYPSGYGARDRRLNPAEYPSLSAAAYAAQQQQTKQQQQQSVSTSQVQMSSGLSRVLVCIFAAGYRASIPSAGKWTVG